MFFGIPNNKTKASRRWLVSFKKRFGLSRREHKPKPPKPLPMYHDELPPTLKPETDPCDGGDCEGDDCEYVGENPGDAVEEWDGEPIEIQEVIDVHFEEEKPEAVEEWEKL